MNCVQQQREHHHKKILIENFHLSGHTFRFRWTVQDLHTKHESKIKVYSDFAMNLETFESGT